MGYNGAAMQVAVRHRDHIPMAGGLRFNTVIRHVFPNPAVRAGIITNWVYPRAMSQHCWKNDWDLSSCVSMDIAIDLTVSMDPGGEF